MKRALVFFVFCPALLLAGNPFSHVDLGGGFTASDNMGYESGPGPAVMFGFVTCEAGQRFSGEVRLFLSHQPKVATDRGFRYELLGLANVRLADWGDGSSALFVQGGVDYSRLDAGRWVKDNIHPVLGVKWTWRSSGWARETVELVGRYYFRDTVATNDVSMVEGGARFIVPLSSRLGLLVQARLRHHRFTGSHDNTWRNGVSADLFAGLRINFSK